MNYQIVIAEKVVLAVKACDKETCTCVTPMSVKKGDKVLYGKYSGTEIVHEGKELLIMRETDILAVL